VSASVDSVHDPIALAVPLFFLLIGIELAWARREGRTVYRLGDALTNLSCGIASQIFMLAWGAAQLAIFAFVFEHWRVVTLTPGVLPWIVAFVGVDFLYYWWHRLSHEVNVLWAAHVVHHQSEDYNLAVALRQALLTSWTAIPFYLPLAFLGVPPLVFATIHAFSTLYQFWIHTELVGRVRGPLAWLFNLPSHHRVHHAINPQYLDKNYGATLIVWDRLFGTFTEEDEACVFGITKPLASFDPIWVQVHYWFEMAAMARAGRGLDKVRAWLASPAWKPPGYVVKTPPVHGRTKYEGALSPRLRRYVLVQYALVVGATFVLMMWHHTIATPVLAVAGGSVLGALVAIGALLEGRRWAVPAEVARLALGVLAFALWLRPALF
jgi:alkylglycerol monooxygenase